MEALRARGLNLKRASIAIGRYETMLCTAAKRGTMSRTVANSLEKMLGIKPEDYAPLPQKEPEKKPAPSFEECVPKAATATILDKLLFLAAELEQRAREGRL